MAPADRSCLIVDRFQHSFAPHVVIGASPSVYSVGGLREVDAPARMRVDDEQSILGIEAWGPIVRQSAFVWCNDASVRRRLFRWIRNRTPLLVDSKRPIHRTIRHRQEILSVRAIENEEVAVS